MIPAGAGGDRFFVLEVSDVHYNDAKFFGQLLHELGYDRDGNFVGVERGGELDRFFTYLASAVDVSAFHPQRDKPHTPEHDLQREYSLSGVGRILMQVLDRGELSYVVKEMVPDYEGERYFVASRTFREFYERAAGHPISYTDTMFGRDVMDTLGLTSTDKNEMKRLSQKGIPGTKSVASGRWFPELKEARSLWEARYFGGRSFNWSNDSDVWTIISPYQQ